MITDEWRVEKVSECESNACPNACAPHAKHMPHQVHIWELELEQPLEFDFLVHNKGWITKKNRRLTSTRAEAHHHPDASFRRTVFELFTTYSSVRSGVTGLFGDGREALKQQSAQFRQLFSVDSAANEFDSSLWDSDWLRIARKHANQRKLKSGQKDANAAPRYKTLRELKLQRLEFEAEGGPRRAFLASEDESATAAAENVALAFEDLIHLYESTGRGICFVDLKGVQLVRGQNEQKLADNPSASQSIAASAVHKVENLCTHIDVGSTIWHDEKGEGKILEIDPSHARGRPFQVCFQKDKRIHAYTQGQVCVRKSMSTRARMFLCICRSSTSLD